MILIITYDLKTPKDYHDFYEAIKMQGTEGKWWHYMASTWILSTTKTPQEVVDSIRPKLDPQDFLFVCELSPNYQGWLPKPAWDWINAELSPSPYNALAALYGKGLVPPPPPTTTPDLLSSLLGKLPKPPDKP